MSRYFQAVIKENLPLNSNHNLISLSCPKPSTEYMPGQFFMVEVTKGTDPLLKRAFSLFRITDDGFELLYRIKGKGTSILRNLKSGAVLDILGPLGNSYPLPVDDVTPLVIAGGIGIASVFPLILQLKGRAVVFYGAKTKNELFMVNELRKKSRELFISTDDGTEGKKGTTLDSLNHYLEHNAPDALKTVIYACGPAKLLKSLANLGSSRNIKTWISMEEHMACGIGACLGCVVNTKCGYKRVCKEGPVFDASEIIW